MTLDCDCKAVLPKVFERLLQVVVLQQEHQRTASLLDIRNAISARILTFQRRKKKPELSSVQLTYQLPSTVADAREMGNRPLNEFELTVHLDDQFYKTCFNIEGHLELLEKAKV